MREVQIRFAEFCPPVKFSLKMAGLRAFGADKNEFRKRVFRALLQINYVDCSGI